MDILIDVLLFLIPTIVCAWISAQREFYGPDWRKGRRQYQEWLDAVEWHRQERRRQREEYGDELPASIWWPPHDIMLDGSSVKRGIESEHTAALRRRYPLWFEMHRQ